MPISRSSAAGRHPCPKRAADLNPWAVGCYTSMARIKQKHRRLENDLFMAEKMASAAAYQGLMKYPGDELHDALLDLAFSEFHDILPGSAIEPAEESSLRRLDHGLEILSRVKAHAFFALAESEPAAKDGEIPILVYNPASVQGDRPRRVRIRALRNQRRPAAISFPRSMPTAARFPASRRRKSAA